MQILDYSKGFGGKFGVQDDRKDKSAVGWDYVEAPQKHESQLDHKVVSNLRIIPSFWSIKSYCRVSEVNLEYKVIVWTNQLSVSKKIPMRLVLITLKQNRI